MISEINIKKITVDDVEWDKIHPNVQLFLLSKYGDKTKAIEFLYQSMMQKHAPEHPCRTCGAWEMDNSRVEILGFCTRTISDRKKQALTPPNSFCAQHTYYLPLHHTDSE